METKNIISEEKFNKINKIWDGTDLRLKEYNNKEKGKIVHAIDIHFKKEDGRMCFILFFLESRTYTLNNFVGNEEQPSHTMPFYIYEKVEKTIKELGWREQKTNNETFDIDSARKIVNSQCCNHSVSIKADSGNYVTYCTKCGKIFDIKPCFDSKWTCTME